MNFYNIANFDIVAVVTSGNLVALAYTVPMTAAFSLQILPAPTLCG